MHSTRMLIVDDHAASRSILRQHLTGWGVMVTEAESGQRALEIMDKALAGEYDVLIIDGEMPDMSGEDLAAAIRSRADFAEVPLVMMNASHVVIPAAATSRQGAIAWLSKPIRRTQLHACLTGLLADYSSTDERRAADSRLRAGGAAREGSRKVRARRVLLVEDNPVNQEVARAMLQDLGVETVSAWSGEEALEKLAAERYDVVLMDCQMPNLDGYMTTTRFREWEQEQRRPRTLIVALTANALSGDAEKCFAAGMDRYLSKPFTIEQLQGVLDHGVSDAPAPAVDTKDENTVLDPHTLRRIRALRRPGSPDLFARVVGLYTKNSLELIEALRTAALRSDHAVILQTVHALKSSSANVGATMLASLCKDIEAAVGEGKVDFACVLVETLLAEHKIVLQALEQALGEQSIAA
jgi:CheY-like chemotaxis protein